jgi:Uma2 family endonuclease
LPARSTGSSSHPAAPSSAAGVARSEADDEFRLPDVFVTCEPTLAQFFRSPRLVVEVLSPSTEKDDRTVKFDFYQSLPSVKAVLLVWQERRRAQLHIRQGARWLGQDQIGSGTLDVSGLGVVLSLDEIYRGLDVPDAPAG